MPIFRPSLVFWHRIDNDGLDLLSMLLQVVSISHIQVSYKDSCSSFHLLPFIVASRWHTCAIFLLFNQHLDVPHLRGGMDYLGKEEVLTNTDLWEINVREKWVFCICGKCLRSLSLALENGSKSVTFIFLFSTSISEVWLGSNSHCDCTLNAS